MDFWRLAAVIAIVASGVLSSDAVAQKPSVAWDSDYQGAFKRAKDENKPIMVAFILKDEPANEEMCREHFFNKEIVEESKKFVCLVACLGSHNANGGDPCPTFPGITCGAHMAVDFAARNQLLDSPNVDAPQFLFFHPDGKTMLLRHVWMLAPSDLLKKMKLAYAFFDPSTASSESMKHRDLVSQLLVDANDNNESKRKTAMNTLARMDDPRVMEFLIKQTAADVDTPRRIEAIQSMKENGNAKAVKCLHKLVLGDDSQIRMYAAISLAGIHMKESAGPLEKALKKENKDRVRSHVFRALFSCCDDEKQLHAITLQLVKSNSQLDQVCGLYHASMLKRDDELDKAIIKAASANNSQVRCAAFYAAGILKIEKAKDGISKRISGEKEPAQSFARWTLSKLGGPEYMGPIDPGSEVAKMLPDSDLY